MLTNAPHETASKFPLIAITIVTKSNIRLIALANHVSQIDCERELRVDRETLGFLSDKADFNTGVISGNGRGLLHSVPAFNVR
jgi:hypothetical protein